MAEIINQNVFDSTKKFVDFAGLDYFWEKAKAYVDAADTALKGRLDTAEGKIATLETTVGDANSGIVKEVNALRKEVNALGGAEGGIQGMIDATIDGLKLPETYDDKGSAATALTDAKAYVDGKVDGKFDDKGSAAAAEAAAKAYAYGLASNYDAAGSADAVEGKLDLHTTDTDIHITAQERTDWNAAKTAIDTFLKDAELDAEGVNVIDTLKELQSYVGSDPATALVTRVGNLETAVKTINGDGEGSITKAANDALDAAKLYVDGKVDGKFDAVGSAAAAEANAKAYAASYTNALYSSITFAQNSDIDTIFNVSAE